MRGVLLICAVSFKIPQIKSRRSPEGTGGKGVSKAVTVRICSLDAMASSRMSSGKWDSTTLPDCLLSFGKKEVSDAERDEIIDPEE